MDIESEHATRYIGVSLKIMYLKNSGKLKPPNLYPSTRDVSLSRYVIDGEVNIVKIQVIEKIPKQASVCLVDMEVKSVHLMTAYFFTMILPSTTFSIKKQMQKVISQSLALLILGKDLL